MGDRRRVLVTGAAGFMGSHVAEACIDLGMDVVAVDDLSGGFLANVPDGATWVEADLRNAETVKALWSDHGPFVFVYHLAAYAAEGLSHFIRAFNYRNNLEASINLVNQSLLHAVERFVFTSSIAVYGSGQLPMSEDQVPRPEDPYGISKYAVELDLAAARESHGLRYTVFRPHNVYGERQNIADPYRNVVGIFMNAGLSDRPFPIFGDGSQTRAFSHVADVAPVIALSPLIDAAANETFNVGAEEAVTVLELAGVVARALDVDLRIEHLPARREVIHAFSDHAKARDAFDLGEPIALADGISRMAAWARQHGARQPIEFAEPIEVPIGLPPKWQRGNSS